MRRDSLAPAVPESALVHRYFEPREGRRMAKLAPGGIHVTGEDEDIVTILGSCVAACIHDPVSKVGGMNHFMLPETKLDQAGSNGFPGLTSDAMRYGCHAMEFLLNEILKAGGRKSRLVTKVFGGANLLSGCTAIGDLNSRFVLRYLHAEGLPVSAQDLGGSAPRKLKFHPVSGRTFLWRPGQSQLLPLLDREQSYGKSLASASCAGEIELFSSPSPRR